VSCIAVKNLDRMGRDHLRVGLYMEQFQARGVRFVAVNDGIDTARGEDDFTPFRAILAEWYAKDCSRKVKAVFHSKGKSGRPLCTVPIYGYVKDPNDRDRQVIEPEAAGVVRRMYEMATEGKGPFQIARQLCLDGIDRPSYYHVRMGLLPPSKRCDPDRRCNWDGSSVRNIIQNPVYKGDLVNFKTTKPSYKNHRSVENPRENWAVFEDYYPAIVERETWDLAQKLLRTRRRPGRGEPNPLTGLLFCADCGAKMSNRRIIKERGDANGEGRTYSGDYYECSTNRIHGARFISKCSLHFVTSAAVNAMILETIRHVALYARGNEAEFAEKLREASTVRKAGEAKENRRRLARNEARIAELDTLFRRVYEDNAIGKLSDERFETMSGGYEREQAELRAESAGLQATLDAYERDGQSAERFLALARKYPDFDELTPQMLHEFVDRVVVHEGDRSSGERRQRIDIHLNFVGRFAVPGSDREPTQEELAAKRADFERRRRNRANYRARCDRKKAERLGAENATAIGQTT
jgi:hypothetical protein